MVQQPFIDDAADLADATALRIAWRARGSMQLLTPQGIGARSGQRSAP